MIFIHEFKDIKYKGCNLFIDYLDNKFIGTVEGNNLITVNKYHRSYIPLKYYLRDLNPDTIEITDNTLCITMNSIDSKGLKNLCRLLDSEDYTLGKKVIQYDECNSGPSFAVYFKIPKYTPNDGFEYLDEMIEDLNQDLDDLLGCYND